VSPDLLLPIITSAAWLILSGASLASFRLEWGQMIKMALAWVVIFLGLFVVAEWFLLAQGTASALL
jgi:Na+/H+ antiporter NhaB